MLLIPYAAILAFALWDLSIRPSGRLPEQVFGNLNWLYCLTLIPVFALVPFVAMVRVLRRGAPTNLPGAGFATGLFAASATSLVYAAHCPYDAPTFVALWYPLTFITCGLFGAWLVPRVVPW